ncbi:SubName: Full=Uncharacterized protein {ECO:0000313/EMBL:CCA68971.1} [Serendipita indica DSM 11827]|nr:SubName: Full=Uncharacterized protein {ECO:0000313/EMBL:CCA68971.1} [Serendipita indica DSM 11827]
MSNPLTDNQSQQQKAPAADAVGATATARAKRAKRAGELAAKQEKQDMHNAFIQGLETELHSFLQSSTIPPVVAQRRQDICMVVERALQAHFGSHVCVQNVGLDRLGISILYAPLELAMVDTRNEQNGTLPDPTDKLYDPTEIEAALKEAGIPAELYTPPRWISPESARRPFALPEPIVISYKLEFVLLPPNPLHSARISLAQECLQQHPSMRHVLALLFFIVATGCHTHLPPLTTTVLVHIAMAYYRQAYKGASPTITVPRSISAPENPDQEAHNSFFSHPSDIIYPNGSPFASSSINGPIKFSYATSSSDMHPNREAHCVTYDLLQLIRWWDEIRWDQDIINSTKQQPDPRNLDTQPALNPRPWDVYHSTLVVSDPTNPLNNLATLVTPFQYAEMRRSCRVAHRRLVNGIPFGLARRLTRPLLHDPTTLSTRGYSSESVKDYGDYLTSEMQQLYQSTRPNPDVLRRRQQTLNHLSKIVQRHYGDRFQPVLFGSSRYGVSDSGSDLDIVILDKRLEKGFEPHVKKKDLHDIYNLRQLSYRMKSTFDKMVVIDGAKSQSVRNAWFKARDIRSNMAVDININDRLGLYNTELLSHYCALWPSLSNLIYVVKKWAKSRGLNDPAGLPRAGGPSFSSYCLTLMVIGFLQTHGVLPNLQDAKYLIRHSPELRGHADVFWIRRSETSRMKTNVDWFPLPLHEWRPLNSPPLGRVFYAWMMYFAYDHKFSDFAIRIAEGGIVPRITKKKKESTKKSKKQATPTADEASEDGETQDPHHSEEADNEMVEAVTDDLTALELEQATAQAEHMQEEDQDLEEVLEEHRFEQKTRLDEPDKWKFDQFVVGDPFILEKNCAGNISKRKLEEFIIECQNTVRMMDEGKDLLNILSGGLLMTENKKGKKRKKGLEPFVDPKVLKALAPPGSPRGLSMRKALDSADDQAVIVTPKAQSKESRLQGQEKRPSRPKKPKASPNPSQ